MGIRSLNRDAIIKLRGGYSSVAERLSVAQDVVGSIPPSRPIKNKRLSLKNLTPARKTRQNITHFWGNPIAQQLYLRHRTFLGYGACFVAGCLWGTGFYFSRLWRSTR
jgi:hypothetical protein